MPRCASKQLQVLTTGQILAEDTTAEDFGKQWQLLMAYACRMSPQDAHRHVPIAHANDGLCSCLKLAHTEALAV